MKVMPFLLASLLPGLAAADMDVDALKGRIVSFMSFKGDTKCYVAIDDPNESGVARGFHHIDDKFMCATARAAYLIGAKVIATTRREVGVTEILALEMTKDPMASYWHPPSKPVR